MKSLLILILLFPLFTFGQETSIFSMNDPRLGIPIEGNQTKPEEQKASLSPNMFTLFLESNIDYAPIGVKFMIQQDNNFGAFVSVKLSEDHFTRNVNKNKDIDVDLIEKNADYFDINEFIVCGGPVFSITSSINFYLGAGMMYGKKYVPYSTYIHYDKTVTIEEWVKTNKYMTMPLLSFGIILTKNKFKFSFGNETAFAKKDNYPVGYLNEKSFARLSSFTFGVGYTFGKK